MLTYGVLPLKPLRLIVFMCFWLQFVRSHEVSILGQWQAAGCVNTKTDEIGKQLALSTCFLFFVGLSYVCRFSYFSIFHNKSGQQPYFLPPPGLSRKHGLN